LQFDNTQRAIQIAEAAKFASTRIVIGLGSQAELGPVNGLIHEKLEDNPTTQYGHAKVSTRIELNKLFLNTATRFHWFRIFSVYGPLDIGPWLIPQLVDSLLDRKPIKLTRGEQEWSYLHIYDLVWAMEFLLQNSIKSEICNVGNPQTITIRNAVTAIARFLNSENVLNFGELAYRADQVMQLKPMCESLTSVGWQPIVSFQNGIEHTIDWLQGVSRNQLELMNGESFQTFLPVRSSIQNRR
jgi:nucleoside-diphosphate-sugar epimerase